MLDSINLHRRQQSTTTSLIYNDTTATNDGGIGKLCSNYVSDLYTPSDNNNVDQTFSKDVASKVQEYKNINTKLFLMNLTQKMKYRSK